MKASFRITDPFLSHPPVMALGELPLEMQSLADRLSHMEDPAAAVRYAYDTLAQRYKGRRFLTFFSA